MMNLDAEFDLSQREYISLHADLKRVLRQLKARSKELEKKLYSETRKGNIKILQEKHRTVILQRKRGLGLLKDLRRTHLNM